MTETPMTPKAARVRLAQYGERTKTWSTATHADGTARALYEIALTLNAEAQTLRARVDALEAQAGALRAPHVKFADSDHCEHDGERWPCSTVAVLGDDERPIDEDPIRYALTEQADAEVFVPRTERRHWEAIAAALNAAHAAGMPVGIDLDGTLTDHRMWSVVWDREAERWTVAGYEGGDA
ncbi:hypothetical protein OG411_19140 [Streptomyces pseudogriseolus]|uniref:hypothetical protein n=1 Tax=Streptomyces pseudogriseolus TaxID=36817 RepID=UPI003248E4BF